MLLPGWRLGRGLREYPLRTALLVSALLLLCGSARADDVAGARVLQERAEASALGTRILSWQPDGLQSLSDAELALVAAQYRVAAARLNAIAADLVPGSQLTPKQLDAACAKEAARIAKEKACRASKPCMAERDFDARELPAMCAADQQLGEDRAGMAREKANPSGVVDLELLHRYGVAIQTDQAILAGFLPEFAMAKRHAWRGWHLECH